MIAIASRQVIAKVQGRWSVPCVTHSWICIVHVHGSTALEVGLGGGMCLGRQWIATKLQLTGVLRMSWWNGRLPSSTSVLVIPTLVHHLLSGEALSNEHLSQRSCDC